MFLGQSTLPLHVEHKIATSDEFDDEEEPRGRLETRMEANEEGMIRGCLEYVLLRLHPVDILVVRYQCLLYNLHSIDPLCTFKLDHEYLRV